MLFYRFLTIVLSPVIFGHILWISISNKQSRYFWQRLGFKYSKLPTNSLWFHCASVGEVNTVLPLLKNIYQKNNKLNFIITTNTITGGKIVSQQNLAYLFHSYLPFDWSYSVNRFLSKTKPLSIYIMETEIWPNLFTACFENNTAITLINARLSSKTTSANAWVKSLLKSSLSRVQAIYARTERDAQAYKTLGAKEEIITTVGNLKLTTTLNNTLSHNKNSILISREYVLVASTHKDEEIQIYNIWKKLHRNELLVIAPRHPERSAAINKKLNCTNIAIRSKKQSVNEQTEIFLLDTVGELHNLFQNAILVIMGGSFASIGGHNILEPASFNKAIITGPHMENFKEELELMLEKQAIVQVASIKELQKQLIALLDNKDLRNALQNNTEKLTHNAKKVVTNYSDLILKQIP